MKTLIEAYQEAILGKDIIENEQIILSSKCAWASYKFARDVATANIKAHEKVVLTNKDPLYCFVFARDIFEADKQLLSQVVLDSLNEFFIERFYKYVDFDKTEYNKYIMFI